MLGFLETKDQSLMAVAPGSLAVCNLTDMGWMDASPYNVRQILCLAHHQRNIVDNDAIHSKIRTYIQDEFLDGQADAPGIDDDLLELGFLDSLRVVRLKASSKESYA